MGGRGASSGKPYKLNGKWHNYGNEYHSVLEVDNIKFVKANNGSATAPTETMTKGRVYVTVNNKDELKYITYMNKNNRRLKQIDLSEHIINGKLVDYHKHKGYNHQGKPKELNQTEKRMVERVIKIWYNRNRNG